jgi:hypothetical protein
MKKIKLFMCLVFIAFSLPVWAQSPATPAGQDSLQIRLQGRNQVIITKKSLKALTEYKRADSLKTLFLVDLRKSFANNVFAETPKRMHYFVNQQGKRRLKAEINEDDAANFNLEYEKNRMKQDLPPLHYTIYDLPQNVEIHFFLEDTSALKVISETSLNGGVQVLEKDRKKLGGLTAYKLEKTGFGFEKHNRAPSREMHLEVVPSCGALLLGNQPSPLLGYEIYLTPPTIPRWSKNYYRLGFSYNLFVLTEFSEGQFRNVNPGDFWHGSLQFDFGTGKENWLGLTVGQISTWDPSGLPDKAFKFGLLANYGLNSFSFDAVNIEKYKFGWGKRRQMIMISYKRTLF